MSRVPRIEEIAEWEPMSPLMVPARKLLFLATWQDGTSSRLEGHDLYVGSHVQTGFPGDPDWPLGLPLVTAFAEPLRVHLVIRPSPSSDRAPLLWTPSAVRDD